jgi:organic hydroperoxide reductase OsmC/OhrA
MNQEQTFRAVAWWSSGQTGIVKSDSAPSAVHFTAPLASGGVEGRWTPEDLLLGSIASCFTTTCRALAERSLLEPTDLQVEVDGVAAPAGSGCPFKEIVIRANMIVPLEEEQSRALKLLEKAQSVCAISRLLAVRPTLEPVVTVAAPSFVA